MVRIANAQFWVHDADEALAFYTRTLGWEVRSDVTMEEWSFRWLVVGLELPRSRGHLILGETLEEGGPCGSSREVPGGVPS